MPNPDPRLLAGHVSQLPPTERRAGEVIWSLERDGVTFVAELLQQPVAGWYATVFRGDELWTSKRWRTRNLAMKWLDEKKVVLLPP